MNKVDAPAPPIYLPNQSELNELERLSGENTRQTRDLTTPHAAVSGGTGDDDQQSFLDSTLRRHMPMVQGYGGSMQCGIVAINLGQLPPAASNSTDPTDGVSYQAGTPLLVQPTGPSMWGQTMVSPAYLRVTKTGGSCFYTARPSDDALAELIGRAGDSIVFLNFRQLIDGATKNGGLEEILVYRSLNESGPYTKIGSTPGLSAGTGTYQQPPFSLSYASSNLMNGTTYYFKIQASNCKGVGPMLGPVAFTPAHQDNNDDDPDNDPANHPGERRIWSWYQGTDIGGNPNGWHVAKRWVPISYIIRDHCYEHELAEGQGYDPDYCRANGGGNSGSGSGSF